MKGDNKMKKIIISLTLIVALLPFGSYANENFNYEIIYEKAKNEYIENTKEEDLLKKMLDYTHKDLKEKYDLDIFKEGVTYRIIDNNRYRLGGSTSPLSMVNIFEKNFDYSSDLVYETLIHEIGHQVNYRYFTKEDFAKYLSLRGVGLENYIETLKTSDLNGWQLHLLESFAEDFKTIFQREDYDLKNDTFLGTLNEDEKEVMKDFILEVIQKNNNEEKVDEIRWYWFYQNNDDLLEMLEMADKMKL